MCSDSDRNMSASLTRITRQVSRMFDLNLAVQKGRRFDVIFIDYNDKRPIYEQVTEKIQTLILNGVLEPDSKLPSVRSLAMELSINPNTIQRAYSELEREGFIYSVKGRGNFVKMNENLIIKEQEKLLIKFKENVEELRARGILKEQALACINEAYDI